MAASHAAVAQQADASPPIRLIIGTDVGGSYDAIGRLMARHLGSRLLGAPTVTPQNMPGASGMVATNFLYNVAPHDGSTIGVIVPQVILNRIFGDANARFEIDGFNWLGNPLGAAALTTVFHTSRVTDWRSAIGAQALMGATGANGPDAFAVRLANLTLGSRFKVIPGYKGGADISLAMERGEVDGRGSQTWSGWRATNPSWVAEGKIVPLWQLATKRDAELPDTPLLADVVEGEANKSLVRLYSTIASLGRPFVIPPGVDRAIVARLRRAFDETMRDPYFQRDAAALGVELGPMPGADLQAMLAAINTVDAATRERLRGVLDDRAAP